jgi:hypothetical protein
MNIVEQAARTVSNIAAGNAIQIQALITNNVVRPMVDVLGNGDFECQKEAARAITNIISGKTFQFSRCRLIFLNFVFFIFRWHCRADRFVAPVWCHSIALRFIRGGRQQDYLGRVGRIG